MTPKEAGIRAAVPGDLDAVAGIFSHYVINTLITFEETPPTVAQWQERLDDLAERGLPFLVAEVRAQVVGYAYAGPWRPKPAYRHTVEDTVYLAAGWTGLGLGQAGARQVIAVIADTGDSASIALHRAFGFADAGRLSAVGHKHGHWIDTLLMQHDLTTHAA